MAADVRRQLPERVRFVQPGTRLGHYEVLGALGQGGMGEVWRARDTQLGREVAIKTLPEIFARDDERLARFEREARLLAAVNHPNIAVIYGLEDADGKRFLALELVEGETLALRLKRGAIPVEQSLRLALQIAEALEAAHERGVVHRDLKPANIQITPEGRVKVLDFGLAKAFGGGERHDGLSSSPTLSLAAAERGMIFGTAAYMAPEQARGEPVDARADVWAFGCILFEMLTGKGTFDGKTTSDVLASVLKVDPDWTLLPPNLHPRIEHLLERCLEKEPRDRYQGIADARVDIKAVLGAPDGAHGAFMSQDRAQPGLARIRAQTALAVLVAVVVTASVGALFFERQEAVDTASVPLTFEFSPSPGVTLSVWGWRVPFAISPDARWLAFVASSNGGPRSLWVRDMTSGRVQPIPGTAGAHSLFWSPDSRSVAFWLANDLYKAAIPGGVSERIGRIRGATISRQGSWGTNGQILVGAAATGLYIMPAAGGTAELLSEVYALSPAWLSDGRHFIYAGADGIYLDAVDRRDSARLILRYLQAPRGTRIEYVSGYIFYVTDGILWAHAFDEAALELAGEPRRLASGIPGSPFSVSNNGVVVYWRQALIQPTAQLVWLDRNGSRLEPVGSTTVYDGFDLAPDESRVVAAHVDQIVTTLWIHDLRAGGAFPLAFNDGTATVPLYTSAGTEITFLSNGTLKQAAADGYADPVTLIAEPPGNKLAGSWTGSDDALIYELWTTDNAIDLIVYHAEDGRREPVPWNTPANETAGRFSPDGRWVAYVSDRSGRDEVWVAAYPSGQPQRPVSASGGTHPEWNGDGTELYFISSGGLLTAVQFGGVEGAEIAIGERTELFAMSGPVDVAAGSHNMYKPTSDGQRFLIAEKASTNVEPLNVIVNWERLLEGD